MAGPARGRPPRPAVPLAGRLALELLVVFVGVYAASMLAGRQARQAEVERTHALRAALASEVDYIRTKGEELDLTPLVVYADAIAAGARPPLQPFASRMPFSPDVWEAAMASGGVQLLDPALLIRMAAFYGEVRGFMGEIEAHRTYVRELLLPNLDHPTSEFYDDAGQIRQKYAWYYQHLRWLPAEVDRLRQEADSLHQLLDAPPVRPR